VAHHILVWGKLWARGKVEVERL